MTLDDCKQDLLRLLVIIAHGYILIFFLLLLFEGKLDYFKPFYLSSVVAIATHKYSSKSQK